MTGNSGKQEKKMRLYKSIGTLVLVTSLLSGCGGGSSDAPAFALTDTPDSLHRVHFAPQTAFTLEELSYDENVRASPHHTVYSEVHHPGSAMSQLSTRSIPYIFSKPVTKRVCLNDQEQGAHRVRVLDSAGNIVADLNSESQPSCASVNFEAGEYEIEFSHGGSGDSSTPLHVFTHARFTETTADSEFGQWLDQKSSATESLGTIRTDSDSSCKLIETITLKSRRTGSFVDITSPLIKAAPYETYGSKVRGLMAYPASNKLAEKTSSASNQIDVYDCPEGVKFGVPKSPLYLQSQCGYLLFTADKLEDATPFSLKWDSSIRRLDIINKDENIVVDMTPRGTGRVVGGYLRVLLIPPEFWTGIGRLGKYSSLGTCSNYPSGIAGSGMPKDSKGNLIYPELGVYMMAEFSFKSEGIYTDYEEAKARGLKDLTELANFYALSSSIQKLFKKRIAQLEASLRQAVGREMYTEKKTTLLGSQVDVTDSGGFQSNHQTEILVSVNSCESCDISGIDLSGRVFGALDLKNSQLDSVKMDGVTAASLSLQGGKLNNVSMKNADFASSDFSGATLTNVDFSGAHLASTEFKAVTQFSDASIFSSKFAENDLRNGNWAGVSLKDTSFTDVLLTDLDMTGAKLQNVKISASSNTATMNGIIFSGADIADSQFSKAEIKKGDFSGANIKSVLMAGADLSGADFTGASFSGGSLSSSFLVGANFSSAVFTGTSFDEVEAYSSGTERTTFEGCTVDSGSFANANFMESSFANCKFHGGSFSESVFVSSSFAGAKVFFDATAQSVSFARSLFAGTDFGGADLSGADMSNAILSRKHGSVDILILTSPGKSITRTYNYATTIKPSVTDGNTICPNLAVGPCSSDSDWLASKPPVYGGKEDLNDW